MYANYSNSVLLIIFALVIIVMICCIFDRRLFNDLNGQFYSDVY